VASGDLHIDSGWLAAAAGVLAALVTSTGLWLGQRLVGQAALKKARTDGAAMLIDQLQEERKEYRAMLAADRAAHDLLVTGIRAEWDEERVLNAKTHATLQGEISNLTQTVKSLKRWLAHNGVPMPPEPYEAPARMVVLRQEELPDEDAQDAQDA
jgi:hypothetical protein